MYLFLFFCCLFAPLKGDFLEHYVTKNLNNKRVAYQFNPGNAGDALIWYGTLCLFDKLGISFTPFCLADRNSTDVFLFGGGGNFVPYYNSCSNFLESVMHLGKPVIVLPHSIRGHESLLANLPPNVILFCRERESYHYCRSIVPTRKNIYLSRDLAFYADLKKLRLKKPEVTQKNLYAFRLDCEVNTNRMGIPLPASNQDISMTCGLIMDTNDDQNYRVVKRFLNTINRYDVVWTDRLHVGIAAFLLGKKVHLFDNSYGKVRSVYEFTLKHLDQKNQVVFHEDWSILHSK